MKVAYRAPWVVVHGRSSWWSDLSVNSVNERDPNLLNRVVLFS